MILSEFQKTEDKIYYLLDADVGIAEKTNICTVGKYDIEDAIPNSIWIKFVKDNCDIDITEQILNDEIRDKLTEIHKALKSVTKVKTQIKQLKKSIIDKEKNKELIDFATKISKEITTIENNLYQTKSKSNQDPLNFPIKLNNKLAHLNSLSSMGDFKPTDQAVAFKNEIFKQIDKELTDLYNIFKTDVKALNTKVKESSINLIQID